MGKKLNAAPGGEAIKNPKKKKKKIIISVICIILVAAIAAGGFLIFGRNKSSSQSYSFIRTTTLSKGSLEDSVSATGTVESASTSNVTTSLTYSVKTVNVSVGDEVKEGDVICTLDTSDLDEQIEREESNLSTQKSQAQSTYDSAEKSYNKAKTTLSDSKTDLNEAKSTLTAATTPYNKAKNAISSYQSAYDKALTAYNTAGAKYISLMNSYNKAVSNYKKGKISASKLVSAATAYMQAVYNYCGGCAVGSFDISDSSSSSAAISEDASASQSESKSGSEAAASSSGANSASSSSSDTVTITQTAQDICSEVSQTVYNLCQKTVSCSSGSNTLYKLSAAAANLQNAKAGCNYNSLYSAYTAAKSAYKTAKQTYGQNEDSLSQAKTQMDEAEAQLESASTSDTLSELKSQLEECTVKAEQDGTVTALNATVGSVSDSKNAIATISDLDSLKVSITIEEADINNVSIGMSCYVTSDASDNTVNATLTQIDPVANENGSFGAEVTIDDSDTDLKIGMNASAEILISSTDDVFQVPIDAVGSDDTGSFVYRKTSGEGTDMQFEKVYITTGNKNDYYIEISSDDLNEGDVIRSSSDLSEGIDSGTTSDSDSSSSIFSSIFGGGGGGSMPDNVGGSAPGGSSQGGSGSSGNNAGGTPPQMPGGGN